MVRKIVMCALYGCLLISVATAQQLSFQKLCSTFINGYRDLYLPATQLDYKVNFSTIQTAEDVERQEAFFTFIKSQAANIREKELSPAELLRYRQINYETGLQLERIALEKKWMGEGRNIPQTNLYAPDNSSSWYAYYVKRFTSVNITPAEVFEIGKSEVAKIQSQLLKIRNALGFKTDDELYAYLKKDTFYLSDRERIRAAYAQIDKTVRLHLDELFLKHQPDRLSVMEWPDAGLNTPPGMYSAKTDSVYENDVFLYNFYNGRHNIRSMEWLYMHEGIPGHHLQSVVRRAQKKTELQNEFLYFGNMEGWACYVEDHGKELGLYQNPYTWLGKWEWDLVRSARLVMEVGIHYYGWSYEKAKEYWKENIKGQDEIADREIKRITNWAGQALCYKVGALTIQKIIDLKLKKGEDLKQAHELFLEHSDVPLQVLLDSVN